MDGVVRLEALEDVDFLKEIAALEEFKDFFRRWAPLWTLTDQQLRDNLAGLYVIKQEDRFEGVVVMCNLDNASKQLEFGLAILGREDTDRRLIAVEAITQVAEYALEYARLNKIYAKVYSKRKSLINSLVSFGFKVEAEFRENILVDGKFHNETQLSLLASDYRRLYK